MTETSNPPARVYLAGPAQHSLCSWVEGHHVLESFANNLGGDPRFTRKGEAASEKKKDKAESDLLSRYRATFASMALDSGAYSNMTAERRGEKAPVTLDNYILFAQAHGAAYDWCAVMDDITGGAEGNRRNWVKCRDARIPRLMPVFHQGEPLSLLDEYVAGSDFIGLGFQRPIQDETAWLDSVFARIPASKWVHGFAMTNYLRFPFRSADSKTWLHEALAIESASGQGKSALAYLTKREIVELVVKKYQRQWKSDLWRGTFGVAAGRGEQMDITEAIEALRDLEGT